MKGLSDEVTAATVVSLEKRLSRLEDVEAIRNLKAEYARLCDDNYNAEALAAMFTEDAVWDGAQLGMYVGRDAIREFFAGVSKQIQWAFHLMIGPEIDIDPSGVGASGKWFLFEPCSMTSRAGGTDLEPVLMMAKYDDRYRKVGGVWRFERVTVHYEAISGLSEGWVRQRFR